MYTATCPLDMEQILLPSVMWMLVSLSFSLFFLFVFFFLKKTILIGVIFDPLSAIA